MTDDGWDYTPSSDDWDAVPLTFTCSLCGDDEKYGFPAIDDHLRLAHPDDYGDGPARWPDGDIVIHDETLEPEDFQ